VLGGYREGEQVFDAHSRAFLEVHSVCESSFVLV
jgi:hypothetical protein